MLKIYPRESISKYKNQFMSPRAMVDDVKDFSLMIENIESI